MKRASHRSFQFFLALFFLLTFTNNPIRVDAQPASVEIYLPSITRSPLHWNKMSNGLPDDWVRDILINPSSPHEILIAYRDSGIYRSADHGQSWSEVWGFAQASDPSVRQLAVSKSNPNILYATINRVRSTNRAPAGGHLALRIWRWVGGRCRSCCPDQFIGINADVPLTFTRPKMLVRPDERIYQWDHGMFRPSIITPDKIYAGGNTIYRITLGDTCLSA
jgi:hypothetical protein